MSLNDDAGSHVAALDAAFRLARGEGLNDAQLDGMTPELIAAARNYGTGRLADNYAEMDFDVLQDMAGYLRIESALRALTGKAITDQDFLAMAKGSRVPPYLRAYYLGISAFRHRKVERAMQLFSKAREQLEDMVVKHGRFVDGSIRGVVSARSLPEFEKICRSARPEQGDVRFPYLLDAAPPRARQCHIVGCDESYWFKYRDLFLTWATPLSAEADIWVNCTNFSNVAIAQVRRAAPFAFLSIDRNDFANKMPYYTMTRFILADKLARAHGYDAISCSDIDIFVDTDRYGACVAEAQPGLTAIYQPGSFPWRSSDAKFTIWKGAEGQRMLLWIIAYYCEAYRPEITGHNRQWFIDQYVLALLAELAGGAYPAWSLEPSAFHIVPRKAFPMKSPAEERMSKEDFAARYARVAAV
jgi:hypothetical protein